MFDNFIKSVLPNINGNNLLSSAEISKKIEELKTIEAWMKINLQMLQLNIQTLETQKQLIGGLENFTGVSPTVEKTESIQNEQTQKAHSSKKASKKIKNKPELLSQIKNITTNDNLKYQNPLGNILSVYNEIITKSIDNINNSSKKTSIPTKTKHKLVRK